MNALTVVERQLTAALQQQSNSLAWQLWR